jgi:hypothetical protein
MTLHGRGFKNRSFRLTINPATKPQTLAYATLKVDEGSDTEEEGEDDLGRSQNALSMQDLTQLVRAWGFADVAFFALSPC